MRIGKSILWVLGALLLVTTGFMIVPVLLKIYGGEFYKESLKKDTIDYEKLGPKIVKK